MGGFNIKHIEQHIAWLNITPYTDNTRFLALCLFVVACRASESSWPPLSEKSLLDTICRTWQWVCVFFSDLQWGFQHAVTQWLLETVWLKSAIRSKISVRHFRPQNERHHPVFLLNSGNKFARHSGLFRRMSSWSSCSSAAQEGSSAMHFRLFNGCTKTRTSWQTALSACLFSMQIETSWKEVLVHPNECPQILLQTFTTIWFQLARISWSIWNLSIGQGGAASASHFGCLGMVAIPCETVTLQHWSHGQSWQWSLAMGLCKLQKPGLWRRLKLLLYCPLGHLAINLRYTWRASNVSNMLSIASAFNTRTTNIDIPHPTQRRLATSNSIRHIEVTEPQGSSTELDEVFIAKEARSEHI